MLFHQILPTEVETSHVLPFLDVLSLSRFSLTSRTCNRVVRALWQTQKPSVHLKSWSPTLTKALDKGQFLVASTEIWNKQISKRMSRGVIPRKVTFNLLQRLLTDGDTDDICRGCGVWCTANNTRRSNRYFEFQGTFLHGEAPRGTAVHEGGISCVPVCSHCYDLLKEQNRVRGGSTHKFLGHVFLVDACNPVND